jgi:DNA-binding transcriptional MerR regulator
MSKSSQAFRTIREVAVWLDVAAHVLRFWETKFPQIKPVKRAGGRRYYRPADMELVGGIKVLLHDRGLTIRGVQKMIREDGVAAVVALSPPLDLGGIDRIGDAAITDWIDDAEAERADGAITIEEGSTAVAVEPRQTSLPFAEPEADEVPETEILADEPDLAAEAPDELTQPSVPAMPDAAAGPIPQAVPPRGMANPTPSPAPAHSAIDRLVDLAARAGQLSPDALSRARPALAALRDRMRKEPPDPAA